MYRSSRFQSRFFRGAAGSAIRIHATLETALDEAKLAAGEPPA